MHIQKHIALLSLAALIATGCASAENQNQNTSSFNNDSNPLILDDAAGKGVASIQLTSPQEGQVLASPFLVGGTARSAGDTVYVRVKNPSGDVVISEQAKIKQDETGSSVFGILIRFVFSATEKGTVEVFGKDESGREQGMRSVEVNFDTSSSGSVENPAQ